MNNIKTSNHHTSALYAALIIVFVGVLSLSTYPILDEGSYLWISERFLFSRPYDWPLPFPPFDDAFVFAHPPLLLMWIASLQSLGLSGWLLKCVLGLPLWSLLGYGSYRLCAIYSVQPKKSFAMWLSLPIVLMVLSRTAMPDLMMLSFATTAMWLFSESELETTEHTQSSKYRLLAGVFLGLASWCKYPALLLWIPIFLCIKNPTQNIKWMLLGFLGIWGLGELWLLVTYQKFHLWEVIVRAIEIPRGPIWDRFVGFSLRLMVGAPLLFWGFQRIRWNLGVAFFAMGIIGLGAWTLFDMHLSIAQKIVVCMCLGIFGYYMGHSFVKPNHHSPDKANPKFLQYWVFVVWVGIVVTHNYAAPRYWILALLPMVLLISPLQIRNLWLVACGGWSISLLVAEHQFAKQSALAAQHMLQQYKEPQYFTGEWTFRWVLQEQGWTFAEQAIQQNAKIDTTSICVQPKNAIATECFRYSNQTWSGTSFPVLLMDVDEGISYYAETAGFWPLGWNFWGAQKPVEEIRY